MKYSPHKTFLRKKKVSYGLRITGREIERQGCHIISDDHHGNFFQKSIKAAPEKGPPGMRPAQKI